MKGNHLPNGQFSPGNHSHPKPAHRNHPQRLLRGVDQRSPWVRRCKEQITEMLNDYGGHHNTSAAERSIVRRVSTLTVELERLEAKFATAGAASDSDLDLYQRTAGGLRRLLETIGIRGRRPRDVTPTLRELMLRDEP